MLESVDIEALADVGGTPDDEETVVRRTVEFLVRHQGVPDFPDVVELEDVIAGYDEFVATMTGSGGPAS